MGWLQNTRGKQKSLGMAFFTLQKWGSCIHYLEDVNFLPSDTPRYLGHALMANREYERAVSVFKIAAQTTPTTECWIRPGLFEAYEAIDDYDAAIQYCSDGGGDNHSMCLGYAMIENRDYDSAIETLKRLRDSTNNLNIRRWWITLGLNEAYMLKGAYNDAIAHFSTSVSDIDYAWCLPILYLKNGDYDGVINLLEAPIHSGQISRLPDGFAFQYEHSTVDELQLGFSVDIAFLRFLKFVKAWNGINEEVVLMTFDDRGVLRSASRKEWKESLGGGSAAQLVFAAISLSDPSQIVRPADAHSWGEWLLQPLPVALNSGRICARANMDCNSAPRRIMPASKRWK